MRKYRPPVFDVAMKVMIPTTVKIKGVIKKVYKSSTEELFMYPFYINKDDPIEFGRIMSYLDSINPIFGSFKTYGGTENMSNGVYTVFDTAIIDTWWRPDIKSDCQIYICETGEIWNVISNPENIDMRHQFIQFKVQKVGGKP